jgi:hypothetical protein
MSDAGVSKVLNNLQLRGIILFDSLETNTLHASRFQPWVQDGNSCSTGVFAILLHRSRAGEIKVTKKNAPRGTRDGGLPWHRRTSRQYGGRKLKAIPIGGENVHPQVKMTLRASLRQGGLVDASECYGFPEME